MRSTVKSVFLLACLSQVSSLIGLKSGLSTNQHYIKHMTYEYSFISHQLRLLIVIIIDIDIVATAIVGLQAAHKSIKSNI